jgi:SAM-dependent methyltransferase
VTGELDNHQCPVCWVTDRERHLRMYFDALCIWDLIPGARVLHFAPETNLRRDIVALGPVRYVAADLLPTDPETIEMDVTAIPDPASSYDLIVCNHVLEHVDSVEDALAELFRVLAPGGTAVLQTPYASGLARTFEDPGITNDADRLFFYGQADHCRLFGRDLFEAMEASGFDVHLIAHADVLAGIDAFREGVSGAESLILVTKAETDTT